MAHVRYAFWYMSFKLVSDTRDVTYRKKTDTEKGIHYITTGIHKITLNLRLSILIVLA